jgi:hypothetical protein
MVFPSVRCIRFLCLLQDLLTMCNLFSRSCQLFCTVRLLSLKLDQWCMFSLRWALLPQRGLRATFLAAWALSAWTYSTSWAPVSARTHTQKNTRICTYAHTYTHLQHFMGKTRTQKIHACTYAHTCTHLQHLMGTVRTRTHKHTYTKTYTHNTHAPFDGQR